MTAATGHEIQAWADTRKRLWGNRMVVMGVVILGIFTVLAFIDPVLHATVWSARPQVYNPLVGFDPAVLHPSGPSLVHPFGTALSAGVVGLVFGTASAYFRGGFDRVMTHVSDAFVLLPPPLIFLIASKRGLLNPFELGLLYGLFFGLGPATIVVRSRAIAVMERPFIDAARSAGGSPRWIVTHHVVPHVLSHVAVVVLAGVVGALVTQGFVEYLGIEEIRIGLGNLVYNGLTYARALGTGVPWSTLLSGALGISLLASSFYLISAGMREVTDPKRGSRRV
jgi:peptide/nickel transport system permease protein